jgi:hypothetical protein
MRAAPSLLPNLEPSRRWGTSLPEPRVPRFPVVGITGKSDADHMGLWAPEIIIFFQDLVACSALDGKEGHNGGETDGTA